MATLNVFSAKSAILYPSIRYQIFGPLGRPTVKRGSDHYFHTLMSVPAFPNRANFKLQSGLWAWPRGSLTTPIFYAISSHANAILRFLAQKAPPGKSSMRRVKVNVLSAFSHRLKQVETELPNP